MLQYGFDVNIVPCAELLSYTQIKEILGCLTFFSTFQCFDKGDSKTAKLLRYSQLSKENSPVQICLYNVHNFHCSTVHCSAL